MKKIILLLAVSCIAGLGVVRGADHLMRVVGADSCATTERAYNDGDEIDACYTTRGLTPPTI